MPTYEYRCPAGHDFEKFYRKISDAGAEVPCPQCGAVGARKISAGAGLVFKGSGFYITDYGKDGKKDQRTAGAAKGSTDSSGGSDSGSSSGAPTSGESKSAGDAKSAESKPAASAAPAKESKTPPPPAAKPGKPTSE